MGVRRIFLISCRLAIQHTTRGLSRVVCQAAHHKGARVPALERLESYCLPSCGIDISLEVIALTPCQCSSEARMSSAYSRALGSPQRHTNGTMDRGLLRIFSIHDTTPTKAARGLRLRKVSSRPSCLRKSQCDKADSNR